MSPTTNRLAIDPARCSGHGRCYALAPQLFDCDDLGRGTVRTTAVPEVDLDDAENAVDSCPEEAISLLNENG